MQLEVGEIFEGKVTGITKFGAFVAMPDGKNGLVHISEICDHFIKHPLEAVSVGDIVDVKVLSVDVKKERIQLSMKTGTNQVKKPAGGTGGSQTGKQKSGGRRAGGNQSGRRKQKDQGLNLSGLKNFMHNR